MKAYLGSPAEKRDLTLDDLERSTCTSMIYQPLVSEKRVKLWHILVVFPLNTSRKYYKMHNDVFICNHACLSLGNNEFIVSKFPHCFMIFVK